MIRASNPKTMPPCAHGRLVIESAGEHGQLVLNEIPSVAKVQATLFQLVEDEQARLAREDR